jgi:two-component system, OmpR family, response regulator RpaA
MAADAILPPQMSHPSQLSHHSSLVREILSTPEAATLCAVDRRTMLRWLEAGLVPFHRTGGGRRRVLREDLFRFMRERGIPLPSEVGGHPRIAVVDDEAVVLRAIRRLVLQVLPTADVRTALDGFAAGVLVAGFRPRLLFLDVVMPGLSGLEVCRRIRTDRDLDRTAIVIVSAHLDPDLEEELRHAGADRCLRKPFEPGDVVQALIDFADVGVRELATS